MISLDDTFLDDVGLTELPTEQRQAFLQHIYEEFELRVGTSLSHGLSDAQLCEFESLIDRDLGAVTAWLDSVAPDFPEDPLYVTMVEKLSPATPDVLLCEYAASKWLDVNRPDYRTLVAAEYERIKDELRDRAAEILESLGRQSRGSSHDDQ